MDYFDKIGFGTWTFGGRKDPDPQNDDAKDIADIQFAIKSGLKHIDTAQNYADGKCEELVGKAIKKFDRKELFIATKIKHDNMAYNDVINSCKESLKRLDTNYIDLLYVHKPNKDIPIQETARAFNELYKQGLIKNIGISNANIATMKEYQKHLDYPIFAAQCHYNLLVRESKDCGLIDYCTENNIKFIAWRPIKMPTTNQELLEKVANNHNKTKVQVVVRWLTQQDNVHILFKSTNPKHVKEIIDTKNFELTKQEMEELSNGFIDEISTDFTVPLS